MDKNGNWKIVVNIPGQVRILDGGDWTTVREIFASFTMKFKTWTNTTGGTDAKHKKFVMSPKSLELTEMKVMKGSEVMEDEQMMIQSIVNIQLEAMGKRFKDFPYVMSWILRRMPKEFQCLGFKVHDIDLASKKSEIQLSLYG